MWRSDSPEIIKKLGKINYYPKWLKHNSILILCLTSCLQSPMGAGFLKFWRTRIKLRLSVRRIINTKLTCFSMIINLPLTKFRDLLGFRHFNGIWDTLLISRNVQTLWSMGGRWSTSCFACVCFTLLGNLLYSWARTCGSLIITSLKWK